MERGNHWSDYRGYDDNGDGIGDYPYVAQSLFEDMMDRNSVLRVFIHSPVSTALDMASRAFPVFRPEPKLTDKYPLTSPTHIHEMINTAYPELNKTSLSIYLILILLPLLALMNLIKPYKRLLIDRDI